MPRIIASIEARMGSSRLAGKVLNDICGKPALTRLTNRLRLCRLLDGIILATSVEQADNKIEQWAQAEGVAIHRGSEDDVLLRVVEAHQKMNSDVVVEITGDCILIDPELVDMGIETFLANDCDVVTTLRKRSFPIGLDLLIFKCSDLVNVERTVSDAVVREHISPYFIEHPEIYRIINLFAPKRWTAPNHRFVLDYPEDLSFIRKIYSILEPQYGGNFGLEEIMSLVESQPSLLDINKNCTLTTPR